jgi:hypothetical protein
MTIYALCAERNKKYTFCVERDKNKNIQTRTRTYSYFVGGLFIEGATLLITYYQ